MCRLHASLGAISPVIDRVGLLSLPAALLPALLWADELMITQAESLGLPPPAVVVPQDFFHDLSRPMRCGLHSLCSQTGCLPLDSLHGVQLKLGVHLPERLQFLVEFFPELRAPLRRPTPSPIPDLGSLVCQISYASGMMCCL